jgi:carbon storage regulator
MLVLTRRVGEEIVIDDRIHVRISSVHGKKIRLAITAPQSVTVLRGEIYRRRREFEDTPPDSSQPVVESIGLKDQLCAHT